MTPHKESQERKDWRASQERMVGKLVCFRSTSDYPYPYCTSKVLTNPATYYNTWEVIPGWRALPGLALLEPFLLVEVTTTISARNHLHHTMIHGLHPDHGPFLCLLFPTNCMEEVKGEE